MSKTDSKYYGSRVSGCILGGAMGDALGAPVEFMGGDSIFGAYGPEGVRGYSPNEGAPAGKITDDTQMTLFTMEGILRAFNRADAGFPLDNSMLHDAYMRWFDTQSTAFHSRLSDPHRDGWLADQEWLYSRRAPGTTCMGALRSTSRATIGTKTLNDSKGCGTVMRAAPFGLIPVTCGEDEELLKTMAWEASNYTHGHESAAVSSVALALIVSHLLRGESLVESVTEAMRTIAGIDSNGETSIALQNAVNLSSSGKPSMHKVESLGGGWVAEEALAIAVYSALSFPEEKHFMEALSLAVSHSGDSDSTGSITGNILGALHGRHAVPQWLLYELEGREVINAICDDFAIYMSIRFGLDPVDTLPVDWLTWYPVTRRF